MNRNKQPTFFYFTEAVAAYDKNEEEAKTQPITSTIHTTMKRIATLITCHNRRAKTILCLKSLFKAIRLCHINVEFTVYLVDDGSTDGTPDAVGALFPEVTIIKGNGNLFWAGGMRLAWEWAINSGKEYDAFLLLNDDVELMENFLIGLMATHTYCETHYHQQGMYVCSTVDLRKSEFSYGGSLLKKVGLRLKMSPICPGNEPTPCSIANANILLVTQPVVKAIGILDPQYTHQIADYDYSYTASHKGIPVLVSPGIGGTCIDDHGNSWLPPSSTLKDRLYFLYNPMGLAYKEQLYYLKKHFKLQLPYYFCMLWLKTLLPILWEKYKVKQMQVIGE